jgi:hypothetical protein
MFDHIWFWNPRMGEKTRKGKRCRVLKRGKRNSIMVELEDGEIVIASRYSIRKAPPTFRNSENLFTQHS